MKVRTLALTALALAVAASTGGCYRRHYYRRGVYVQPQPVYVQTAPQPVYVQPAPQPVYVQPAQQTVYVGQ